VGSGDLQVLQHGPRVDGHDLYGMSVRIQQKGSDTYTHDGQRRGVVYKVVKLSSWRNVAWLLNELLAMLLFKVCVITKRG